MRNAARQIDMAVDLAYAILTSPIGIERLPMSNTDSEVSTRLKLPIEFISKIRYKLGLVPAPAFFTFPTKEDIIALLGSKCSLCGCVEQDVLQIDHVDGGGTRERRRLTGDNYQHICRELLLGSQSYQVLCANCNWEKSQSVYSGTSTPSILRKQAIFELGSTCAKCGGSRALQIDHVNGGGRQHRLLFKGRSKPFYYRQIISSAKAHEGKYQLLCANCNWRKRLTNHESKGRPKAGLPE